MKHLYLFLWLLSFTVYSQAFEPEENFYFATSEKCFYQLLDAMDTNNTKKILELESYHCIFKYDKNRYNFKMIPFELGNPKKPISLTVPTKFKIIGKIPKELNSPIIWTRSEFAKKL